VLIHTAITGFVAYFFCFLQPSTPVELELVEESVEDRGSLSTSFRVAPLDLRQDQSFEKLYKVVGSNDVYIRRAGGLRAVFRNSVYEETEGGFIPIVPAGTIYCIGQVSPRVLRQLGVIIEPTDVVEQVMSQEVQSVRQNSSPRRNILHTGTIRFIDDESYRRQRLALFVLKVAMSN